MRCMPSVGALDVGDAESSKSCDYLAEYTLHAPPCCAAASSMQQSDAIGRSGRDQLSAAHCIAMLAA